MIKIFCNIVFFSSQLYTHYWISGEGNFEIEATKIDLQL